MTDDLPWAPAFDDFAQAFFARHEVPGAAISIVTRNGSVYRRGFGLRDREAGAPATPATVFGIASLTKSVTGLTTLALQAAGVLSIDDPVTQHLPDFAYPGLGEDVRLRHLLSHSSGLPPLRALDFAIHPSQVNDPASVHNRRDYVGAPSVDDYPRLLAYLRAGERRALAGPGAVMSYSNEGVALMGAVIESATGEGFPTVVRRLVLEPLGMASTTFDSVAAMATGEATTLYTRIPDRTVIRSPVWEEAPAYLATGFLKSSADDLGRYLTAMLDGCRRLGLDAELFAEALAPRVWSEPDGHYAFGWQVRPHRGVTVVRHGGSLKGVSSHQGLVPELGFGMAILTNLDEVPVKRLWNAALNLATGQAAETPLFAAERYVMVDAAAAQDAHAQAKYAGVYASGEPWGRFELVEDAADGSLRALVGEDAEDSGKLALLGDAEFVLVTADGASEGGRFHFDEEGTPYAVQHGGRWYDKTPSSSPPR